MIGMILKYIKWGHHPPEKDVSHYMLDQVKKIYWQHFHFRSLHRALRLLLDGTVNVAARVARFNFPSHYIRHWKVDMLFGGYERETTRLCRRLLRPGLTVIDLGAHIGYYTRLFAKLVGGAGQVLAIEADATNYSFLRENTKHLKNVKARQLAIADKPGRLDFFLSEGKSGDHSLIAGVVPNQRKISVKASDLDSWLVREGIKRVDFIKMDIEGGEPAALAGMQNVLTSNHDIALLTEFAPAWLRKAGVEPLDYLSRIRALGFKIFEISKNGLVPFNPTNETEILKAVAPSCFINLYCQR